MILPNYLLVSSLLITVRVAHRENLLCPKHWIKSFTSVIPYHSPMEIVIPLLLQDKMRPIAQDGQSPSQTQTKSRTGLLTQ